MPLRDSSLDFGSSRAVASGHHNEPLVPALMIAWAPSEPERLGEVALIEPEGGASILGRGAPPEGSGCERLVFSRQRPGSLDLTEPLQSQGLSREQLRIRVERGRLKVERIGR